MIHPAVSVNDATQMGQRCKLHSWLDLDQDTEVGHMDTSINDGGHHFVDAGVGQGQVKFTGNQRIAPWRRDKEQKVVAIVECCPCHEIGMMQGQVTKRQQADDALRVLDDVTIDLVTSP